MSATIDSASTSRGAVTSTTPSVSTSRGATASTTPSACTSCCCASSKRPPNFSLTSLDFSLTLLDFSLTSLDFSLTSLDFSLTSLNCVEEDFSPSPVPSFDLNSTSVGDLAVDSRVVSAPATKFDSDAAAAGVILRFSFLSMLVFTAFVLLVSAAKFSTDGGHKSGSSSSSS